MSGFTRTGLLSMGIAALVWAPALAQHHEGAHPAPAATEAHPAQGDLTTPAAMRVEHHHLHEQLAEALASGGETAAAAREVAQVLAPHFVEEDRYAMPPLSLLQPLGEGKQITPEQRQAAIAMADMLRAHYGQMVEEHKQITVALRKLAAAAQTEGKPGQQAFAEALLLHAQNEEQVLYPATLLLGEYLKLTAPQPKPAADPKADHAHH